MSDWSDGFDLSDFWNSGYDVPSMDGGVALGNIPYTPSGGGGGGAGAFGVSEADNANAGAFTNPGTWGGQPSVPQINGGSGGANGKPGIFTNGDGSPNWASILGVLGPLLGGAYTANRTGAANQQMQEAVKQANAQITSTLGGNSELFKPYRDAGAVGLDRLVNMPQSNLSSRYRPLGAGNGFSLGNIAKGQ